MKLTDTSTQESIEWWSSPDRQGRLDSNGEWNFSRPYVCSVLSYKKGPPPTGALDGMEDFHDTKFVQAKSPERAAAAACELLRHNPDKCHVFVRLFDERETNNEGEESTALPEEAQ
jgi:hypothetical protein